MACKRNATKVAHGITKSAGCPGVGQATTLNNNSETSGSSLGYGFRFSGSPKQVAAAQKWAAQVQAVLDDPEALPEAVALVAMRSDFGAPSDHWSVFNYLMMRLSGYSEARTFKEWGKLGRKVRAGEQAFYILQPDKKSLWVKKVDEDGDPILDQDGNSIRERKTYIKGWVGTPRFGYEQTEPMPEEWLKKRGMTTDDVYDQRVRLEREAEWIRSLPFSEVAKEWGIDVKVATYRPWNNAAAAHISSWESDDDGLPVREEIVLEVEDEVAWVHELAHAADLRTRLREGETHFSNHWKNEQDIEEAAVQLAAATLLTSTGREEKANLGMTHRYIEAYVARAVHRRLMADNKLQQDEVRQEVRREVFERAVRNVALITSEAERISQREKHEL